jgi:3-hydroxybutyryl-CoA dehydratase
MHKGDRFTHVFQTNHEIYSGFIQVFGDRNPLHTDEDFARSKGFAGRVMHGNILNGYLSFLVGECLPVKNVMIYSQQIDFKKPVYLGDSLELTAVVDEVFESVNLVELSFDFVNQHAQKVAKGKIQIGLLK